MPDKPELKQRTSPLKAPLKDDDQETETMPIPVLPILPTPPSLGTPRKHNPTPSSTESNRVEADPPDNPALGKEIQDEGATESIRRSSGRTIRRPQYLQDYVT